MVCCIFLTLRRDRQPLGVLVSPPSQKSAGGPLGEPLDPLLLIYGDRAAGRQEAV